MSVTSLTSYPVIDKAAFQNIKSYIDFAASSVKLLFLWEAVAMTAWVTSLSLPSSRLPTPGSN